MQIGVRLHDVNASLGPEEQTLEARAKRAAAEGFCCTHLAFSKVMKGMPTDACSLNEGLARYTKRVLDKNGLDLAVLGCYLNLAHPEPEALRTIQSKYFAHIRLASLMGACVVGTETGAPNAAYQTDANTHSQEALESFIRGLAPVVDCAEKYGVSVAIEPVWKHIVYDADRAVQVLRAIQSQNLRIIFDPVNVLCPENLCDRNKVIGDMMEKLADEIAVVHLKDYVIEDGNMKSIAAGTGEMDYTEILRFLKARKPYIYATLENTTNDNAAASREFLERQYSEV